MCEIRFGINNLTSTFQKKKMREIRFGINNLTSTTHNINTINLTMPINEFTLKNTKNGINNIFY